MSGFHFSPEPWRAIAGVPAVCIGTCRSRFLLILGWFLFATLLCGCGYGQRRFVPTAWLAPHLHDSHILILDARPEGSRSEGFLPGAAVLWREDCAEVPDDLLAACLGQHGISGREKIIVYDNGTDCPGHAGRVAWMLELAGHPDVHLLDGGIEKWAAEGRPLDPAPAAMPVADFQAHTTRPELRVDTAAMPTALDNDTWLVVDVRTEEEFNGWQVQGRNVSGHLPGALHLSITDLHTAEHTLKSRGQLREIFAARGLSPDRKIVFYSDTGVRSALACLVGLHLGYAHVASYDGSLQALTADAGLALQAGFANHRLLYPARRLRRESARGEAPVVLDCRSADRYAAGHIPGAISLPATAISEPEFPNRLLPPESLREVLGGCGLTSAETVVVYTDPPGAWGEDGRVFWALEYMGQADARVLNGGWPAWVAAGGAQETGTRVPQTAVFSGTPDPDLLAATDYIADRLQSDDMCIIDTRTLEEYQGVAPYGSARGGRIPGAIHFDYEYFFDEDWTLRNHDEIEIDLTDLGITPTCEAVLYCTIGVRSGFGYFALRLLGYARVRNYDGSWYAWAADPSLPIEK